MDRQLRAGLAVRGWLEPAYYLLGADFTGSSDTGSLSYMAAMGGWGILDYALDFAPEPCDWLQLGYASYLSSWALMNTGRPETNYGFWFPGAENDGASGWQFMTAKFGRAWIRKDVPRGPWPYDGEIDLGFGAGPAHGRHHRGRRSALRLVAYGGTLRHDRRRSWRSCRATGCGSGSAWCCRRGRMQARRAAQAARAPSGPNSAATGSWRDGPSCSTGR